MSDARLDLLRFVLGRPILDAAIGAGAGGLVSSRQSARRGAKSALISEKLAGGDCLNVGTCVKSLRPTCRCQISRPEGVLIERVRYDFPLTMQAASPPRR